MTQPISFTFKAEVDEFLERTRLAAEALDKFQRGSVKVTGSFKEMSDGSIQFVKRMEAVTRAGLRIVEVQKQVADSRPEFREDIKVDNAFIDPEKLSPSVVSTDFEDRNASLNRLLEGMREFATAQQEQLSLNAELLRAEETRREVAKQTNAELLRDEETRREVTKQTNSELLRDEETRREVTKQTNAELLRDEETRREVTKQTNADLQRTEETRREVAKQTNAELLRDEETRREVTKQTNADLQRTEETRREVTKQTNAELLRDEETRREVAKQTTAELLRDEETRREVTKQTNADLQRTEEIRRETIKQETADLGRLEAARRQASKQDAADQHRNEQARRQAAKQDIADMERLEIARRKAQVDAIRGKLNRRGDFSEAEIESRFSTTNTDRVNATLKAQKSLNLALAEQNGLLGVANGIWRNVFHLAFLRLALHGMFQLRQVISNVIHEAIEFSDRVAEIQTIIGKEQQGPQGRSEIIDAALSFSTRRATELSQVVESFYQSLSNQVSDSIPGLLAFSDVAADLAKITVSSLQDASNALTSVIQTYGRSFAEAEDIAQKFFKLVDLGRLRLKDTENIGTVLVPAEALGIEPEEIFAAIETLTIKGQSAARVMTGLRNFMQDLIKPSKNLQEIFDEWGVPSGEAAVAAFDIFGIFERLDELAQGGIANLGEPLRDLRSMQIALGLTGHGLEDFKEAYQKTIEAGEDFQENMEQVTLSAGQEVKGAFIQLRNEMFKLFGINAVDFLATIDDLGNRLVRWSKILLSTTIVVGTFTASLYLIPRAIAAAVAAWEILTTIGTGASIFAAFGGVPALLSVIAAAAATAAAAMLLFGKSSNQTLAEFNQRLSDINVEKLRTLNRELAKTAIAVRQATKVEFNDINLQGAAVTRTLDAQAFLTENIIENEKARLQFQKDQLGNLKDSKQEYVFLADASGKINEETGEIQGNWELSNAALEEQVRLHEEIIEKLTKEIELSLERDKQTATTFEEGRFDRIFRQAADDSEKVSLLFNRFEKFKTKGIELFNEGNVEDGRRALDEALESLSKADSISFNVFQEIQKARQEAFNTGDFSKLDSLSFDVAGLDKFQSEFQELENLNTSLESRFRENAEAKRAEEEREKQAIQEILNQRLTDLTTVDNALQSIERTQERILEIQADTRFGEEEKQQLLNNELITLSLQTANENIVKSLQKQFDLQLQLFALENARADLALSNQQQDAARNLNLDNQTKAQESFSQLADQAKVFSKGLSGIIDLSEGTIFDSFNNQLEVAQQGINLNLHTLGDPTALAEDRKKAIEQVHLFVDQAKAILKKMESPGESGFFSELVAGFFLNLSEDDKALINEATKFSSGTFGSIAPELFDNATDSAAAYLETQKALTVATEDYTKKSEAYRAIIEENKSALAKGVKTTEEAIEAQDAAAKSAQDAAVKTALLTQKLESLGNLNPIDLNDKIIPFEDTFEDTFDPTQGNLRQIQDGINFGNALLRSGQELQPVEDQTDIVIFPDGTMGTSAEFQKALDAYRDGILASRDRIPTPELIDGGYDNEGNFVTLEDIRNRRQTFLDNLQNASKPEEGNQSFQELVNEATQEDPIIAATKSLANFFTTLKEETISARTEIQFVLDIMQQLQGLSSGTALSVGGVVPQYLASGGPVPKYFASGGPAGTDTVPAWLTPGEFVVNASSAKANRQLLGLINGARGRTISPQPSVTHNSNEFNTEVNLKTTGSTITDAIMIGRRLETQQRRKTIGRRRIF